MNSRKVLLFTLPVFIVGSLIGVGFCSWYFGHDELKIDNNNISVYTLSDVTKGTLSLIKAPSKIVFSQGEGESNDLKDGIDYYTSTDGSSSLDDEIILKYTLKDKNDSITGSYFNFFISIEGTIFSDCITISNDYIDSKDESKGYDFSKHIEVVNTSSETEPYGYFKYSLNLKDVIEYKSVDVKPTSLERYQNLQKALSDGKLTIKFVAD